MKHLLYRLFEHSSLDREEAREVLIKMANGEYNESSMAAFITVFLMRSINVDELIGFRDALLELRTPIDLSEYKAIDIVGTGGDNKNTFNVSTAASFVVAGAGYKVIKHGNYGASSICGASNVLEQHGVVFTQDVDKMKRSLDCSNIAYLHAPYFNKAMKHLASVRKALGVRTFFNILGPLVNPTMPKHQLLGVYNLKLARLYHYLYQQTDVNFSIVHSLDGYDEVSLTDEFKLINAHGEQVISPEDLGFSRCVESDLFGGNTVIEASDIFDRVMENRASEAQINTVAINAAYAMQTLEPTLTIEECILKAKESIASGNAHKAFKNFLKINSPL